MKINSTNKMDNQNLKCLIGGFSSAGKTTLAGTIDTPTLVISAESGLLSLRGKEVDYIDLNVNDKGEVLKEPSQRVKRLADVFQYLHDTPNLKYKNVFLDSLSEIGELLVEKLQKDFPDRKDSFPMWGEYSKVMKSIVKKFRDLPYNVFMTCIIEVDKDQNNKRFLSFDIPGRISEKLPQYFDEVFYLMADEDGKRHLHTKATDTLRHAKDRSGRLEALENPDLGLITKKIFVGGKEK